MYTISDKLFPFWWTRHCVPSNHVYEMVNISARIVYQIWYNYI